MSTLLLVAGAVLLILEGVSVILHIANLNAAAALDDKIVAALKQFGVQAPPGTP